MSSGVAPRRGRPLALLALVSVAACPAGAPPTPPRATPPTDAERVSDPPQATTHDPEKGSPPATADTDTDTDVDAAPVDPLLEVLQEVLESSVQHAWTDGAASFLVGAHTRSAYERARELPYPPAARDAAIYGRAVGTVDVWLVRDGQFTQAFSKPVHIQPMACFDVPCDHVRMDWRVTDAGAIELSDGTCPEALATLARSPAERSTYAVYDRATVPVLCRGRGRYTWNGRAFARAPASDTGSSAAAKVQPLAEDAVARAVRDALFPASIASEPTQVWRVPAEPMLSFVLFVHTLAATDAALSVPSGPNTAGWRGARAVKFAEVWTASHGSFRRALKLPVALTALADPTAVVALPVRVEDGALVVGEPSSPCTPATATSEDSATAAVDRAATRLVCASRGRYRFDGRAFARVPPSPAAH